MLFRELGAAGDEKRATDLAVKVAGVVADQAVDGVLPAIFEKANPGYASRILPAVEGCAYPLYFVKTGFAGGTLEQVFWNAEEKRMYDALKEHTRKLLLDADGEICLPMAESSCRRRATTRG